MSYYICFTFDIVQAEWHMLSYTIPMPPNLPPPEWDINPKHEALIVKHGTAEACHGIAIFI
jgi:hypothetical protein